MKLTWKQIEPFLKKPDADVRAVLVYGPDSGLVRERAKTLCLTQLSDLNDPFNSAHLTGEIIKEDPARFTDEADAGSLMGGKRLLRVTDAGNDMAVPLRAWLKSDPSRDVLVVIEAGDLKPKDALRKVCENEMNAAALPCYVEDERALITLIRDSLTEQGFKIASDALSALAQAVKGDRGRARMEIEKLVLYMGKTRSINLHDVQQSAGDIGLHSLDDLVFAFTGGNRELALKTLRVLLDEGTEPVVILRSLQNQVMRLHLVRSLVDNHNQSLDEAMKMLQPPVFFKAADQFKAQVNRWSQTKCRAWIARLNDAENRTKQTGAPVETLLSQLLLGATG